MRRIIRVVLVLCCFLVPSIGLASGTIKGKVTYAGEIPPPKTFVFNSFPNAKYCAKHPSTINEGRSRAFHQIEVGEDGGLKGAVISLRDIQDASWQKAYEQTEIVIELCDFIPYTSVVVNSQNIHVENHDADPDDPKIKEGVLHTVRAYEVLKPRSLVLFGIGLPTNGSELNKSVTLKMQKQGSIVRLACDQHEWMQSWLLPVQNPYYTTVNQSGIFELINVPAGDHTISAWHPLAGHIEKTVSVAEGETAEVNFELRK